MRLGFFGCGNMGSAIAFGLKAKYPQVEQYFFTPSKSSAEKVASAVDGVYVENIIDMPTDLDWYILAFKPQSLNEFSFKFSADARVMSLLAGTSIESLENKFKIKKVARLMPNTPSSIGEGANLLYSSFEIGDMQNMLSSLGKVYLLSTEEELDAITAFSASGPALLFEYARIFETHLKIVTKDEVVAREIITQTFLGSAKLMERAILKGLSFEVLREQVTSKKGVTYEALQVLEKNELEKIMGEAFHAAHARALELKRGI